LVALVATTETAAATPLAVEVDRPPSSAFPGTSVVVEVRAVNTSGAEQDLRLMSCSWPSQWQTDDPELEVDQMPCHKNGEQAIPLPAGGSDRRMLSVRLAPGSTHAHTFKVGFTPIGAKSAIWSRPITLVIADAPLQVVIDAAPATVAPGRPFEVPVRVINPAHVPQQLRVWTCSWDGQWQTDDPELASADPNECSRNGVAAYDLAPGESDSRRLKLQFKPGARGRHRYRVGFTPQGARTPLWSTPRAIEVRP
jgi:hypothetical protein